MTTRDLADRVWGADVARQAGQDVTPRSKSVLDLIRGRKDMYAGVLNNAIDPERFVRVALAAVGRKRDLMNCTQESLLGALMLSAQLGLEPDTPLQQAHLVAYGRECSFIVNYRGYVALAHRAGYQVHAEAVFEDDEFSWELGLNPTIVHKPTAPDRTDYDKLTYAYAVARSRTDPAEAPQFVVMTRAEIEKIRKRARSQNGPWKTDPIPMAVKCPVRRLSKWMPMSVQMAQAAAVDERAPRSEHASLDDLDVIDVEASDNDEISPPAATRSEPTSPGHVDAVSTQADDGAVPPAESPAEPAPDDTEEAVASSRDHVKEFLADLDETQKPAWIAFMRSKGLSSNPDRWTAAQVDAVLDWLHQPRDEGAE